MTLVTNEAKERMMPVNPTILPSHHCGLAILHHGRDKNLAFLNDRVVPQLNLKKCLGIGISYLTMKDVSGMSKQKKVGNRRQKNVYISILLYNDKTKFPFFELDYIQNHIAC